MKLALSHITQPSIRSLIPSRCTCTCSGVGARTPLRLANALFQVTRARPCMTAPYEVHTTVAISTPVRFQQTCRRTGDKCPLRRYMSPVSSYISRSHGFKRRQRTGSYRPHGKPSTKEGMTVTCTGTSPPMHRTPRRRRYWPTPEGAASAARGFTIVPSRVGEPPPRP